MKSIAVFCGANTGTSSVFSEAAEAVGSYLAAQHIEVVFGGGKVGLMGKLADAVLEAGGRITGVIPDFLKTKEVAHFEVSDLVITQNMHERKQLMYDLADAFLILPGGFGTLDEFFEVTTWAQLGQHSKAIGILNVNGYFDPLLNMIENMIDQGFLKPDNARLIMADGEMSNLLLRMKNYQAMPVPKWIKT